MNNKNLIIAFVLPVLIVFGIMFLKMCERMQKSSQDKNVHIEMSLSLLKVMEVKIKCATH